MRLRRSRRTRRRRTLRSLRGPLHLSLDPFLERNLIRFERLPQYLVERNARPLIGRNRSPPPRICAATSMRSSVIRLLKVAVPKANFLRSSSRICSCSLRVLTAVEYRARACRRAIAWFEIATPILLTSRWLVSCEACNCNCSIP